MRVPSLAWVVTIGAFVAASSLLGSVRDAADPLRQGYLSVPPKPLGTMVGGFQNLAADFWYMRFASYWGYQLTHGRHFQNLYPLLDLITDLQPRYMQAYEFGALALGDNKQLDEAVRLLEKGAKHAPENYYFPYKAGMTLFFFGEDYMRAARYFERAARLPGAPPEARYFAARMYEKSTRRDLAIASWRHTYQSAKDPSVRQVAKNALKRLGIPVNSP